MQSCSENRNKCFFPHRQVGIAQNHLLSLDDRLQDPVVQRLCQVEVLHRYVCEEKCFSVTAGRSCTVMRGCVRTFPNSPAAICGVVLVVLGEDVKHVVQALADGVTRVSGTAPGRNESRRVERVRVKESVRHPDMYLSVSASLALGPCLVPDSSVWRRPTLFMAEESGDARLPSCTYFLPVSGVDTFRAEA